MSYQGTSNRNAATGPVPDDTAEWAARVVDSWERETGDPSGTLVPIHNYRRCGLAQPRAVRCQAPVHCRTLARVCGIVGYVGEQP
ncbi:MAG: hypothetical protein ACOC96_09115, partial [Actinomycetota bacterium]